jgi:xylose dehydrogenase (NAD/NADP)
VGVVRVGLLSTARINDLVLRGARASERVEVVAVASRDAGRAQAYAAERGIPRAHGSYEALLADAEVDAVYISLPNALHHEWTMRALKAGKHVLCEKPYSRRPAEVEEAFAAAGRAGLVLSEAFMWRHHPQTARLLELLPSIGSLETVRATFSFVLLRHSDPGDVRLRPELDGGSLMDVGCYCVSGARLLAGDEPERVYGEQVVGPSGVDVRFSGLLRFPSGVVAEFTCAFTSEHMSLEAVGSDGSLFLADPWHAREPVIVHAGREIRLQPADSYRLELENLAEAIAGEAPLLLGREDALGQARAIEALSRSAETGLPVALEQTGGN